MSVGTSLKAAREQKKITLETISKKTRIHIKYLEALEKDDFDVFPSQTYAKSFVRAYSKVVGLDEKEMTSQFKSEVRPKEVRIEPMNVEAEMEKGSGWSPITSLQPIHRKEELAEDPELEQLQEEFVAPFRREPSALRNKRIKAVRRSKFFKVSNIATVLAALIVLVLAAVYYGEKTITTTQWSQMVPKTEAAAPAQPLNTELIEVHDKYQHLVLKGVDKSWVQVVTDDGKGTSEVDMDEGEVKIYQAVKNFKIKIGNAGGVDVYYNGRALGVLGVTGQVVEINLPETGATDSSTDKS